MDSNRKVRRIVIDSDEDELEGESTRTVMNGWNTQQIENVKSITLATPSLSQDIVPAQSSVMSSKTTTATQSPSAHPYTASLRSTAKAQRREALKDLIEKGSKGLQALSSSEDEIDIDDGSSSEEIYIPPKKNKTPRRKRSYVELERSEKEYDFDDGGLDDFIVGSDEEREEQERILEIEIARKDRRRRKKMKAQKALQRSSNKPAINEKRNNSAEQSSDDDVVVLPSSKKSKVVVDDDDDDDDDDDAKGNSSNRTSSSRIEESNAENCDQDGENGEDAGEVESPGGSDDSEEDDSEDDEDGPYGHMLYLQVNAMLDQERDEGLGDVMSLRKVCTQHSRLQWAACNSIVFFLWLKVSALI